MVAEVSKDASPTELRNARRLSDLKVNEVSVVDRPAIRRQFLILKRHLEEGMFDDLSNAGAGVTKAESDRFLTEVVKSLEAYGFAFESIDLEKQFPTDLVTSFKAVVPWMKRMAGQADGDVRAAIMRVASFLSNVGDGQLPVPEKRKAKPEGDMTDKSKDKDKDKQALLEEEEMKGKQKADEEEDEMAMSTGAKGKGKKALPFSGEEEEMKDKKKQKSLSLDEDTSTIIKVDDDGELHIISKGRKKFTQERAAALSEATAKMLSLLKETDEEAYKATLEMVAEKELPKDTKVPSMVRPTGVGGVPAVKSEEEAPAWAIDLQKRLDSIEKARAPSTSVDAAGDTDSKEKQVQKGFWNGVL